MTSYGRIVSFSVMFSISLVWSGVGGLRALASCLAFSTMKLFVGLLPWGGRVVRCAGTGSKRWLARCGLWRSIADNVMLARDRAQAVSLSIT